MERALVGFGPVLPLVLLVAWVSARPASALAFGALVYLVGIALLWRGSGARRAVLPGVLAGAVPLALALAANHIGHQCTGTACMTWCVPACSAGGLAAGLIVAAVGRRTERPIGYWVGASGLALLTGAMGCACVGYSGMIGLAAGFCVGFVPLLGRRSAA